MLLSSKKWISPLIFFLSSIPSCYASNLSTWWLDKSWQPIFSIGGGFTAFSDSGSSENVPIQNPEQDSYYYYAPNHSIHTPRLADVFLGAEWHIQPHWALQTGIGYTQISGNAGGALTQGVDIASQELYSYNYNILSKQLLAETKLLYTIKEGCYP